MKFLRLSGVALVLLLGLTVQGRAGWHGGGWHGGHGGGWHGGGYRHGGSWGWGGPGVIFVGSGYYYPSYPYYGYYGGSYYDDYPAGRAVYPAAGANTSSIAVPVQEQLTSLGYYHGPIDGVVGPGTRSAIAAYQRKNGLEITGVIDTPLIRSLGL